MVIRRLLIAGIALLAGIWDAGVSSWLSGMFAVISFSLPLIIVVSIFSEPDRALIAAIVSGIVLDLFLPSGPGFLTARFVLIVLVLTLLQERVLTNRSMIGVGALTVLGIVLYRLLAAMTEGVFRFFDVFYLPEALPPTVIMIGWNILLVLVSFMIFASFTKRFLPLISREQGRLPLWRK